MTAEGPVGKIADLPQVKTLVHAIGVMDAALMAAYNLDPAAHATTSRDYGRGFAEALRVVREVIDTEMNALHAHLDGLIATQANAEAPKQQKASEVADVDVVLPCGCVPPCEGHHEDES